MKTAKPKQTSFLIEMLSANARTDYLWRLVLLLIIFLIGNSSPAYAINFRALWTYNQSGGSDTETTSTLQERYVLGMGGSLDYNPTNTISATASLGFTRVQQNTDGGNPNYYSSFLPNGEINLVNDIFGVKLAASTTIFRRDEPRTTSSSETSYDLALFSAWRKYLWPQLYFNYSENFSPTQDIFVFVTKGEKVKNTNMGLTWNLIVADLIYSYRIQEEETQSGKIQARSDGHFAKLDTNGRFLNNRVRYKLSQQFQYGTQVFNPDEASTLLLDSVTEYIFYSKVDMETDPNPDDPFYLDPDEISLPQVVDINNRLHILLSTTSFPLQIDILRLSLQDSFTVQEALELQWNIYTRDNQSELWELVNEMVQGSPTVNDENSIDIPINLNSPEILVMAINTPAISFSLTGLEAFRIVTDSDSGSSTSMGYNTNFSMGFRLARNIGASLRLLYDHNESERPNGITFEGNRETISGNLSWRPFSKVSSNLGFSQTRNTQTFRADSLGRNYSLGASFFPLPSLSFSLNTSFRENFFAARKTSALDTYSISARAQIYPDLSASLYTYYTDRNTFLTNGSTIKNTTFATRLELEAQLRPTLYASLLTNYREDNSNASADTRLQMSYRPSDFLGITGYYRTSILPDRNNSRFDLTLALWLLRTPKANLDLNFGHTQSGGNISNNISLNGSWIISKYFSLSPIANLRFADTYFYNIKLQLLMRF